MEFSFMSSARWKIGVIIMVVLATIGWLAFTGIRDSSSYYVTIAELQHNKYSPDRRVRVEGDVVAGSIKAHPGRVDFKLHQGNDILNVSYVGADAPPDTFVDNSQAMASGHLLPNGVFEATALQAKCASKYEPKGARKAGAKLRDRSGTM
jgi:cytochrome c-type biogenesis protein CcmE